MSGHTPAPWHTDGVVVWASDNGGHSFDVPVCAMTSRQENQLSSPAPNAPECGLDNADLIAAAPDLLAALKRVEWSLPGGLCPACHGCGLDKIGRPAPGHTVACLVGIALRRGTPE